MDHSDPTALPPAGSPLYAALAAVGAEIENPARNRTVRVHSARGAYDFRYSTLDVILDEVRPKAAKHGIAIIFIPFRAPQNNGARFEAGVVLRLAHQSGETLEASLSIPCDPDPQKIGSVLTYCERYLLSAVFGVCGSDDDDANIAEGNAVQDIGKSSPKTARPAAPPATAPGNRFAGPPAGLQRAPEPPPESLEPPESPPAVVSPVCPLCGAAAGHDDACDIPVIQKGIMDRFPDKSVPRNILLALGINLRTFEGVTRDSIETLKNQLRAAITTNKKGS